ncbi:MAG TPA: adenylate/guanylate cyclase domain-containing protein [Fluviicola sp.]|nr:adenylate/guanylate cyclase domain-containing protein [Fluviicola sp.]
MSIQTVVRSVLIFLLMSFAGNCALAQNAASLYNEAVSLRSQGKGLKAQKQFEAALEAARNNGDVALQMKCHLELAELKTNVVNYKTAIGHYQAFTELYRRQSTIRTRQLADSVSELESEVVSGNKEISRTKKEIKEKSEEIDSLTTEQLQSKLELAELAIKNKEAEIELHDAINEQRLLWLGIAMVVLVLVFLLFEYFQKRRSNGVLKIKNDEISYEKAKSENLLLNILPDTVAAELKEHGKTSSSRYETATVLFTDFQGFTTFAEQNTPETVVALLDYYFRAFDAIISKYHIEKIKTIGDAYLCVSGVPTRNKDHAVNMIKAALEFQAFMKASVKDAPAGVDSLHMRIGIHTGPVVAGVVGSKKFAYDIWGDTVNIAARFEQTGEPGRINVSEAVVEAADGAFEFEYRGELEAKNKGKMKMFFVKMSNA